MNALVLFYSMYGHIYRMAEAVAEGVREVPGAVAVLKRVPETLSEEIRGKMGALDPQKAFAHVPICTIEELPSYDAIFFGVPTRYGVAVSQMRSFIDAMGGLWVKHALVGKVGGAFSSSSTQHGGQESTLLSMHTTMLHLGMVIVGLPYSFAGQSKLDEVTGCSPYGASTVAGQGASHLPTANELDGARFQGRHTAQIAVKLAAK